jgi:hypothetical protein
VQPDPAVGGAVEAGQWGEPGAGRYPVESQEALAAEGDAHVRGVDRHRARAAGPGGELLGGQPLRGDGPGGEGVDRQRGAQPGSTGDGDQRQQRRVAAQVRPGLLQHAQVIRASSRAVTVSSRVPRYPVAGSPSWRFAESEGDLLFLALAVRDGCALPVPGGPGVPPPLGEVPPAVEVLAPEERPEAARQWAVWWADLVRLVARRVDADRDDSTDLPTCRPGRPIT